MITATNTPHLIRGTCCLCRGIIHANDSVLFFSHGNVVKHAHEECVSCEKVEFAENIGILVEHGVGREIEDFDKD